MAKLEFELHLQDARELFIFDHTAYDPFNDWHLGESGMDHMVARVMGFWLGAPRIHTKIYLPPSKIQPDTQERMGRAMQNFCAGLLVANGRERRDFMINNTIFLGIAILVLLLNWWAQNEIVNPIRIPDPFQRNALSYGLDVLVWVALWTPVSAFLLEWFPLLRRYQTYKALKEMEITVYPDVTPLNNESAKV